MEEKKAGCLLCGEELVYTENRIPARCQYCGEEHETNVQCPQGHYVCDKCHGSSAMDIIQTSCTETKSTNPLLIMETLMRHPSVHMHGPEHHFLVPAVLLAAYYNKVDEGEKKEGKMAEARKRSEKVLGGFCGSHGTCGAAIGTGIFMSLITDSTPLAEEEWQISNMLTARCLTKIAEAGGPRCCKRDSYLAIGETIVFLKERFGVELEEGKVECSFSSLNKQCLLTDCQYHAGN